MNKVVTDAIASYKSKVALALRDQQSALTPCIDPFIYECQVWEYKYDTQRTLVSPIKEVCFRMHYMYLKPMTPRKYIQYLNSNTPISELVANDVIFPFLLFINKKMVPWSMINIIFSHEVYHILCHTSDPTWMEEFKDVRTVDVMHLPDGCKYCVRTTYDPSYNPYLDKNSSKYRPEINPEDPRYRPECDPNNDRYNELMDIYSPSYYPGVDYYREDYRTWSDPTSPDYDPRKDPFNSAYISKMDPDSPDYDPSYNPDTDPFNKPWIKPANPEDTEVVQTDLDFLYTLEMINDGRPDAYNYALKYYPKYWNLNRIQALYVAGLITMDEVRAIQKYIDDGNIPNPNINFSVYTARSDVDYLYALRISDPKIDPYALADNYYPVYWNENRLDGLVLANRITQDEEDAIILKYEGFVDNLPPTNFSRIDEWDIRCDIDFIYAMDVIHDNNVTAYDLAVKHRPSDWEDWKIISLYYAERITKEQAIALLGYIPPDSNGNSVYLPEKPNHVDQYFYGEVIMAFNNDGTFSDDDEGAPISVINAMNHMDFGSFVSSSGVNAYAVSEDTSIKYFPNNVILFRNKLLDTDTAIDFKSTLITIDYGENLRHDQLNFIVFRDTRTSPSVDNIAKASLRYIRPHVQNLNSGSEVPEAMMQLFNNEFAFAMDYKKNYLTNVTESIEYIIGYNAALFEEAYLKNYRNLYIECYEGSQVLDELTVENIWMLPCRHGNFNEERIIMLVNGLFYKYSHMIKYTKFSYCTIPIQGINPEDKVEILRFTDINNYIYDIIINEDDPYKEYDGNYLNDNMVLFSSIPPTDDYEFPEDGIQHFPVEYKILRDSDNSEKIKIVLKDPKYYGIKLKVAYKHRFKHKRYSIDAEQSQSETYHIDLGTDFMYCNDYSKYLIFYNGRRLSTDQYRLCLPVRSTTPFRKFELFLTALVAEGDQLDIIYTSSLMKDVVLKDSISDDGVIEVDKNDITYALTRNTYMVWANGKKIPTEHIANIDSTHLRITEDIGTTKTVCITKFLYDIDDLTKAFQENESLWDRIIAQLTPEQIEAILTINGTKITDTEDWIYDENVSVKAIMYELIREKFIMDAKVDTSKAFAYGYTDVDDTIITGTDSADNALLESNDANIQGNIDDVIRPWP